MKLNWRHFLIEPSSNQESMSRACLGFLCLLISLWVISIILGLPPKELIDSTNNMLWKIIGSVCTIYTVSTGARFFKREEKSESSTTNMEEPK